MILTITQGGSGRGISWWSRFAECPERAYLDTEAQNAGRLSSLDTKPGILVGTILHKYLEHYYNGEIVELAKVTFEGPRELINSAVFRSAKQEADRLFIHYRQNHPRDEWGTVIATELHLEASPAFHSLTGIDNVTAGIDLVVDVTAAASRKLKRTRKILLTPGLYLIDHKTLRLRPWGEITNEYMSSVQFWWYQLAFAATQGRTPQGLIANIILKGTVPQIRTLLIPPPTLRQRELVREFFEGCKYIHDNMHRWKNLKSCYWPSPCPYINRGCDRS